MGLIKKGADILAKDLKGLIPIDLALDEGHVKVVELLYENGGSTKSLGHITPLQKAVERGHHGLVELLISYGADVYVKLLKSPLNGAIDKGDKKMAQILITNGAMDETLFSSRFKTLLYLLEDAPEDFR